MTSADERRLTEASQLLRSVAQSLDDLANRLAEQFGQAEHDRVDAPAHEPSRP